MRTNNVVTTFSEKRTQIIIWTMLCLSPIIGMAVDLVAPSLPAIATRLQVSNGIAKDVISIYLLGYALGNLVTGFLTDALGRQKLLRIGLSIFVIVSSAPLFFPNMIILLASRFFQGLALGGVAVIARSIYSDILPPEKLIRLGTLLGTMWGIGPVIGPIMGGYLQLYFGWQAGFAFFSIVSLILLIAVFIIVPETHFNRHRLNFKTMKKNMTEVLTHRLFMALVVSMGLMYSLIIVFNTSGPFLIQRTFHYSPVFFGHLAFCLGIMFLSATFFCRHLLKHFKMERLFFAMINSFFLIAVLMVVLSYFFAQSVTLVAIGSALMFFVTGFIFPLSMGKGMSLFRHIAGTSTATMYFINVFMTSVSAFLVSFMNMQNAISLMWIYLFLMLASLLVYWTLIREYSSNKSVG